MKPKEIKDRRKMLSITQSELAKRMGVSEQTIINYEKGRNIPKNKQILLRKALGLKQEDTPKETINNRIRFIAHHYKLDMAKFSRKIGLGHNVTLNQIIKDQINPSGPVLEKILEGFPNISAEWLMRGKGNMLLDEPEPNVTIEQLIEILVKTHIRPLSDKIDCMEKNK